MPSVTSSITITDVLNALHANLPNLVTGKEYLLEDLVGTAFWNSMPIGARKSLGQPFKALAQKGGQPVEWLKCQTNNSNVYLVK